MQSLRVYVTKGLTGETTITVSRSTPPQPFSLFIRSSLASNIAPVLFFPYLDLTGYNSDEVLVLPR